METSSKSPSNSNEKAVLEIAVRKVKEGQSDAFKSARSNFISKLKTMDGVGVDREFESFYALPEPDQTEVFIGMTQWSSAEATAKATKVLMQSAEAAAFFSTLDFKAFVQVRPIEGPEFNLIKLASQAGQVLEIAIRSVNANAQEEFNRTRKAFVEKLSTMEGVKESYEFEVLGDNPDRLTVGMTVYANQELFQKVAQALNQAPEAAAYFATFKPIALQYAFSVK